jgi:hypothetical protein
MEAKDRSLSLILRDAFDPRFEVIFIRAPYPRSRYMRINHRTAPNICFSFSNVEGEGERRKRKNRKGEEWGEMVKMEKRKDTAHGLLDPITSSKHENRASKDTSLNCKAGTSKHMSLLQM